MAKIAAVQEYSPWNNTDKEYNRLSTVIGPINKLFGGKLPANTQYISICGQMFDLDGYGLANKSELAHMVRAGVIKPKQFKGIERKKAICLGNTRAIKRSKYSAAKMLSGNVDKVLVKENEGGKLSPGLVNLDTMGGFDVTLDMFKSVLGTLNKTSGRCILVWNFISASTRRKYNHSDRYIVNKLKSVINSGWKWYKIETDNGSGHIYRYTGAGVCSNTTMATIVFYRD
jgi:hypothetical protein